MINTYRLKKKKNYFNGVLIIWKLNKILLTESLYGSVSFIPYLLTGARNILKEYYTIFQCK